MPYVDLKHHPKDRVAGPDEEPFQCQTCRLFVYPNADCTCPACDGDIDGPPLDTESYREDE